MKIKRNARLSCSQRKKLNHDDGTPTGGQFFISALNDPTSWDPLDFSTVAFHPADSLEKLPQKYCSPQLRCQRKECPDCAVTISPNALTLNDVEYYEYLKAQPSVPDWDRANCDPNAHLGATEKA